MAVLVAQHGHLESAYRELCLPILLLGTVLLPWRSAVPPTAWNESLHSTLSPHMHVREGFNLRLPFRDSRKYGLIDPMPMDASATALISGSKGHPLSADIFRRVPNKLLVQLFFTTLPRFLQGSACTCNKPPTPVVLGARQFHFIL
jgi:hypothetical protein